MSVQFLETGKENVYRIYCHSHCKYIHTVVVGKHAVHNISDVDNTHASYI